MRKKALIIGSPNVGKSVLFNALSGKYANVSNYPGTTVEVSRASVQIHDESWEIVDTPGTYSLFPVTEEEKVTRQILLNEPADLIINVIDAKNLERLLPLTLQLLETGLRVIVVLNVMDEARKAGITINTSLLSSELKAPVIPAVCTRNEGVEEIRKAIAGTGSLAKQSKFVTHDSLVEQGISEISALPACPALSGISARSIAILVMSDEAGRLDGVTTPDQFAEAAKNTAVKILRSSNKPLVFRIATAYKNEAERITSETVTENPTAINFAEKLSRIMMNPLTGFPILALILYFGLYKFVGVFGAGTAVDFIEGHLFQTHINPFLSDTVTRLVSWAPLRDLLTGEYGILSLALRYSFGLILPIVTFFFIFFSLLEDSGYLPRLAMLIDRFFKRIGLSGRAVIPMVMGLGCATMATMVTRTLPTKKERIIATLLLALAVPCSAQLGVIMSLLADRPAATGVWAMVIVMVFLSVGFLGSKVISGSQAFFYMEIPPLRWPQLSNILMKTYVRVVWYMKEIIPIFIGASIVIWLAQLTKLFDLLVKVFTWPVSLAGLPPETAKVFLFGFFRRDYGAAGLYDLDRHQLLTNVQVVVACVALTLFLPCIAQFLVNIKERGFRTGMAISAVTLIVSFSVACLLNALLTSTGITL